MCLYLRFWKPVDSPNILLKRSALHRGCAERLEGRVFVVPCFLTDSFYHVSLILAVGFEITLHVRCKNRFLSLNIYFEQH